MAGATRRSDIACTRLAYNPLEEEQCLGYESHRKSCRNPVPRHSREIAYFIMGQGSHLFSEAGELRAILLEAADHLHCCPEHRNSDEVVEKWIKGWKKREGTDRKIKALVEERVLERKATDKKWPGQAAFENHMGQLARSNMPPNRKLDAVKYAIWDDRFMESMNKPSIRRPATRPKLSVDLPRPEPLHLVTSRRRGSESASPASPLPAELDYFDNTPTPVSPLNTVAEDHALDLTTDLPTYSDIRPSIRPQASSVEPHVRPGLGSRRSSMSNTAELAVNQPSRPLSSSRRGRSLTSIGNAFLRAVTLHTSSGTTNRSSTPSAPMPPAITSVTGPSTRQAVTSTTTDSLFESSNEGAIVSTERFVSNRHVDEVEESWSAWQPTSRTATSDPTTSTVSNRTRRLSVASALRFAGVSAAPSRMIECEICLEDYDASKHGSIWECPTCHNKVHKECFTRWWRANAELRQPMPCPYW